MHNSTTRKHFEAQWTCTFYPPRDIQFVVYDKEIWNFTKKLLRRKSNVIVNLGAGGGTLLYCVSKVTSAELVAVDFSDAALAQLKMMVPKARILKEDVSKTSLSNESCDFCLSTMVIEHVDDSEFLKEVYRILRPRGWFLITTVLRRKNAWYFYKNIEGEIVLESSHLREYTSVSNFLSLLKTNGFVVVKIKTPRIKFPLIDPFLKILVRFFKNDFLRRLPTTKPVETFRKITRIPIPGYYAIEVVAQKRDYKKNKFGL